MKILVTIVAVLVQIAGTLALILMLQHPEWPRHYFFRNEWQEIDGTVYLLTATTKIKWDAISWLAIAAVVAVMFGAALFSARRRLE